MRRSLIWLSWAVLWSGLLVCAQPSCDTTAWADEPRSRVSAETVRCELGSIEQVSACGGAMAACHVCARVEMDEGVCVQPCTLGQPGQCPGGQACHPIGELREQAGYARVGDCPAGYCR